MFGGYTRYVWGPRVWKGLRWMPPTLRRGLGTAIEQLPPRVWDSVGSVLPGRPLAQVGDKAHKLAYRLTQTTDADALYRALVTTWRADAAVVRGATPLRTPLDAATATNHRALPLAQRMMFWDSLSYLPDDILQKVDRASMGVSLETRAPFLDHRVAELAWRLPLRMKIRHGKAKWILRSLLHRYVPPALVERPKMGFGVPIDAWLRAPLRDWAEDLLTESRLTSEGYFEPVPIRQKWAEHLSAKRNWQHELWAVLMFQAWLKSGRHGN